MGWLVAVLLALGWFGSEVELEGVSPNDCCNLAAPWRRTSDGWERAQWLTPPKTEKTWIAHPVTFGLLQVLLVFAVAVAMETNRSAGRHPPAKQPPSPEHK